MKKLSLGALVAAGLLMGGLTAGSASAADLGGNCCADLEERIAELEATTARKGNRKVSLTISGWVAEQVMWWDDGVERNTYVGGLGTTLASTRQVHRSGDDLARLVCWLRAAPRSRQRLTRSALSQCTTIRRSSLPRLTGRSGHRAWRLHPAVVLVREERPPRQGQRRSSSRRLRTTRPSSLTVRARSFPPTGCCSTTLASACASPNGAAFGSNLGLHRLLPQHRRWHRW